MDEQDTTRASLISQVRDLFPELGEGFIAACLHHYEDNAEALIDALLNNSLPPSLSSLKRNMPLPARPAAVPAAARAPAAAQPASVLAERRNVFDGDDFDVFAGKAIKSNRVVRGKKYEPSFLRPVPGNVAHTRAYAFLHRAQVDALKFMSQKGEVKKLKSMFEQYQYEDEYDDSYDSFQAVGDADGEVRLKPLSAPFSYLMMLPLCCRAWTLSNPTRTARLSLR